MKVQISFATWAITVAITQLSAFAHPTHNLTQRHHPHLLKRDIGTIKCFGDDREVYDQAWSELPNCLAEARVYLLMIQVYLTESWNPHVGPADLATWTAVQLFEAAFGGPLLYQPQPGQTATQIAALAHDQAERSSTKVAHVLSVIDNLDEGISVSPRLFNTWCSEAWWGKIEKWDTELLKERPDFAGKYSDIREGAKRKWVELPGGKPPCENNPATMGYVTNIGYMYDQPLMTLCPRKMIIWLQAYFDHGQDFSTAAQADWFEDSDGVESAGFHISILGSLFLTTTLVHELTHINAMAHPEEITKVTPVITDVKTSSCPRGAYGWICITNLAINDPDSALINADTYAHFVFAATFNKNNWVTGWPKPLKAQPSS